MLRGVILALSAALLAACAMSVQSRYETGPGFAGPRLEPDTFVSFDGARLHLETWEAEGEPWAVIVGLHGMNDHARGAYWLAAPYWAGQGVTTYAYDQRGFGHSEPRGIWAGEELLTEDLKTMTALARQRHPDAIVAVAGVSMGGAAAISAFADDDSPDADRLVLLAPAVWGWSSQPMQNRLALWAASRVRPGWTLQPPDFLLRRVTPTDNPEELRRLGSDRLMIAAARADAVKGLTDLMESGWAKTGQIEAPTLYLYGYRDDLVPREPSVDAAARLKPTDKTGFYLDGYHLLLSDLQGQRVWDDVLGFLRDPDAPLVSGVTEIPER